MKVAITKHTELGEWVEVHPIYASYGKFPKDRLVLGILYVQRPEEFRQRMGETGKRIGRSEEAVMHTVWKFARYPAQDGETPTAYAIRLAKLPDPPAIFLTGNEVLH